MQQNCISVYMGYNWDVEYAWTSTSCGPTAGVYKAYGGGYPKGEAQCEADLTQVLKITCCAAFSASP